MNQYISTYGKDYSWPDVLDIRAPQPPIATDATCPCVQSQLKIKYPALYGIIKKSCSREKVPKVEAGPMKTTYQVDYSDPAAERMAQHERALVAIKSIDSQLKCRIPVKITIEAYPSRCHLPPSKYKEIKKLDQKGKSSTKKCGKKREDSEGQLIRLPPWKSEYQDSINKIGQNIIKAKLHYAKKQTVPVWSTSN